MDDESVAMRVAMSPGVRYAMECVAYARTALSRAEGAREAAAEALNNCDKTLAAKRELLAEQERLAEAAIARVMEASNE